MEHKDLPLGSIIINPTSKWVFKYLGIYSKEVIHNIYLYKVLYTVDKEEYIIDNYDLSQYIVIKPNRLTSLLYD